MHLLHLQVVLKQLHGVFDLLVVQRGNVSGLVDLHRASGLLGGGLHVACAQYGVVSNGELGN